LEFISIANTVHGGPFIFSLEEYKHALRNNKVVQVRCQAYKNKGKSPTSPWVSSSQFLAPTNSPSHPSADVQTKEMKNDYFEKVTHDDIVDISQCLAKMLSLKSYILPLSRWRNYKRLFGAILIVIVVILFFLYFKVWKHTKTNIKPKKGNWYEINPTNPIEILPNHKSKYI
jgi:hypothetical protein